MDRLILLLRSIKKRGLVNTIRFIYSDFIFDWIYKVDTSSDFSYGYLSEFSLDDFEAPQQGTNPWIVRECFNQLLLDGLIFDGACFLDLGSGKGRVLLIAALSGFSTVIGVERNSHYCEVSRSNLEIARAGLRIFNSDVNCCDVLDFSIPVNVNVVFLYNPFGRSPMKKILSKLLEIRRSRNLHSDSRPLYIIYVNPICADIFKDAGVNPIYNIMDEALIYKITESPKYG